MLRERSCFRKTKATESKFETFSMEKLLSFIHFGSHSKVQYTTMKNCQHWIHLTPANSIQAFPLMEDN